MGQAQEQPSTPKRLKQLFTGFFKKSAAAEPWSDEQACDAVQQEAVLSRSCPQLAILTSGLAAGPESSTPQGLLSAETPRYCFDAAATSTAPAGFILDEEGFPLSPEGTDTPTGPVLAATISPTGLRQGLAQHAPHITSSDAATVAQQQQQQQQQQQPPRSLLVSQEPSAADLVPSTSESPRFLSDDLAGMYSTPGAFTPPPKSVTRLRSGTKVMSSIEDMYADIFGDAAKPSASRSTGHDTAQGRQHQPHAAVSHASPSSQLEAPQGGRGVGLLHGPGSLSTQASITRARGSGGGAYAGIAASHLYAYTDHHQQQLLPNPAHQQQQPQADQHHQHLQQFQQQHQDQHNYQQHYNYDQQQQQQQQQQVQYAAASTTGAGTMMPGPLDDLIPSLPQIRVGRYSASDGTNSQIEESATGSSSSGWQLSASGGAAGGNAPAASESFAQQLLQQQQGEQGKGAQPVPASTGLALDLHRYNSMPQMQYSNASASSSIPGAQASSSDADAQAGLYSRRSASISQGGLPSCARALFTGPGQAGTGRARRASATDPSIAGQPSGHARRLSQLQADLSDHLSVASDDDSIREMNADNVLSSQWGPSQTRLMSFKYCASTSPLGANGRSSPYASPRTTREAPDASAFLLSLSASCPTSPLHSFAGSPFTATRPPLCNSAFASSGMVERAHSIPSNFMHDFGGQQQQQHLHQHQHQQQQQQQQQQHHQQQHGSAPQTPPSQAAQPCSSPVQSATSIAGVAMRNAATQPPDHALNQPGHRHTRHSQFSAGPAHTIADTNQPSMASSDGAPPIQQELHSPKVSDRPRVRRMSSRTNTASMGANLSRLSHNSAVAESPGGSALMASSMGIFGGPLRQSSGLWESLALPSLAEVDFIDRVGKGSFGEVYKGIWNDSLVAVKVIRVRCRRTSDRDADDAHVTAELARHEYESWLNANLRHPNIVQLFTSFTVGLEKPASSSSMGPFALDMAADGEACRVTGAEAGVAGHAASGTVPSGSLSWKTHLIMEYCDMGTMQSALRAGHFRDSTEGGAPRLDAIIATAKEFCAAVAYLHSMGVVHGDLKSTNVLLRSSAITRWDPRGFTAKVSDFGLSQVLDAVSGTVNGTHTFGALTHAAPEVVEGQALDKPADVFSVGVLLWELITSQAPFHGMHAGQLLTAKLQHRTSELLELSSSTHPGMRRLLMACWDPEPLLRPTMDGLIAKLNGLALQCLGEDRALAMFPDLARVLSNKRRSLQLPGTGGGGVAANSNTRASAAGGSGWSNAGSVN